MRLRDNVAIFSTAVAGLCIEALLVLIVSIEGGIDRDRVLLTGQAYLLAACAATYFAGRHFVKPLEVILGGIEEYSRGQLKHRIPPSRVKELDELSQHLNRMADRLHELDRLKDDLIANVSHELRSPLAAIEGYVTLLQEDGAASAQARDNLSRIQVNLARLGRLVENLLEMSALEERGGAPRAQPIDTRKALDEVCELFRLQLRARNLALDLTSPPGLPAVLADPEKFRQALINLMDNAIKYNREGGGVRVSARALDGFVLISIRDTGPGIAAKDIPLLFERFRRLPHALPEYAKVKGAGLGLAISRSWVRLMGGDIVIESEPGRGSTFTLSLPGEKV